MPHIKINGGNLYYETRGEGIPIVFIHPPLLTGINFMYQFEHLSNKYKIITFDIRGHGQSGYSSRVIDYSLIVEDIILLLNELKIKKAFLCGYSTGGSIVLEFLQMHSERAFGGIVISGMSEVNDYYLKLRILTAAGLSTKKTFPLLTYAITRGNANTQQCFKRMQQASSKGDISNIKQYYQFSLKYNCTNQLHKISVPILLVYGAKDKVFHKYAYILQEKLPENELVLLENEHHQIPTKAPQKLHDVMQRFIQSYIRENPFMV
ncbi:alpha/beta fold hydrolase [Lysinibacillus telephonicus]|uniref:alpha/beta fold hydrolase n=1 Tax=Lysinibacillus telephonicus TaxID=1714840 RepID=UPI003BA10227